MAFTVGNTIVASDVNVLGLLIYFRPNKVGAFVDLGHVQNPQRTIDQQELDIQSARTGRLLTVKKLTTSLSKGLTFESMSSTETSVLELHRGSSAAGSTALGTFVAEDVTPTEGDLLIVQRNAETGGPIRVEYRPSCQIKGTDEQSGDGESVALLNFEVTVLADENYTIPATLDGNETAAPLGFVGVVAEDDLENVLDIIAASGEGEGE